MPLFPYGGLSNERLAQATTAPMSDWKRGEAKWKELYAEIVAEVGDHVWPIYANGWHGKAAEFAEDATRDELNICVEEFQADDILLEFPETPLFDRVSGAPKSHLWHYKVEDFAGEAEGSNAFEKARARFPFVNLAYYVPRLNPEVLWSDFARLSISKADGTFRFKLNFQRPRPYEAAFALGVSNFRHRLANRYTHTGLHPSLPSGHCHQGLLVACGLAEELRGSSFSEAEFDALAQFAVDFGDRRVFAGVHYPTDNIVSWVNIIRFIPHIFDDPDYIFEFFNLAISKSKVYKVISKRFSSYDSLSSSLAYLEKYIKV